MNNLVLNAKNTPSASNLLPAMPVLPIGGVGNLEAYISAVNQMPMLTAEEEIKLAKELAEKNDLNAARRLVLSHLRVVVSVSRQYLGYGLPHADLIQEGNIGLMKAVKKFDLSQGTRLVSYAIYWIKAEIHEFILKNWRLVRIATTKPQRKLFFNLRSNKPHLNSMSEDEIHALAKALDVKADDVRHMEIRLGGHDIQLEPDNDDDGPKEIGTWISDSSLEPTEVLMRKEDLVLETAGLDSALHILDERSKRIITARWLFGETDKTPATLHDLAAELNISAERVRQIESAALKKMRDHLNKTTSIET
jgi:RNA polymerase sigma-32 factor